LALGLGIALLLEFLTKVIRTEMDVDSYLHLPTLALLPTLGEKSKKADRV
jgi:capsular polysaccharide biosynthesis protein